MAVISGQTIDMVVRNLAPKIPQVDTKRKL
jgi:hypothetical protein